MPLESALQQVAGDEDRSENEIVSRDKVIEGRTMRGKVSAIAAEPSANRENGKRLRGRPSFRASSPSRKRRRPVRLSASGEV